MKAIDDPKDISIHGGGTNPWIVALAVVAIPLIVWGLSFVALSTKKTDKPIDGTPLAEYCIVVETYRWVTE